MFSASKSKTVRVIPKIEENTIDTETKPKEAKSCSSPQYEIMKVRIKCNGCVLIHEKYNISCVILFEYESDDSSELTKTILLKSKHLSDV